MNQDIYNLTEEEQKEVYELSAQVVERINQIRLLAVTKDLLAVVDKLKTLSIAG